MNAKVMTRVGAPPKTTRPSLQSLTKLITNPETNMLRPKSIDPTFSLIASRIKGTSLCMREREGGEKEEKEGEGKKEKKLKEGKEERETKRWKGRWKGREGVKEGKGWMEVEVGQQAGPT